MKTYYTNDVAFLKDNQTLLTSYKKNRNKDNSNYENIIEVWDEIKNDTNFKEKYYYLDWSFCESLNKSEHFLQFMSLYNLTSPVLSLLIPIFILIIPFFIVKMRGIAVTMEEYIEVLKGLAANHAIGRIFIHFNKVSTNQKLYIVISAIFYVTSIYQNIVTCYKFYQNMKKIHTYLNNVKEYIDGTIISMENFLQYSSNLNTFSEFNEKLHEHIIILSEYKNKISKISKYGFCLTKISEIGYVLKCFYELYNEKHYNDSMFFSFGFNGYIDNIETLIQNVETGKINLAAFTEKSKNKITMFKKSYYAALINEKPVKNNIKLDKNLIITGPNASGKTTILKSTLINVIFTQQFGCGFYESALIHPYKYIHCYLNIPDTSGRDSLFQAEARRCKEIIDIINKNPNDNHLCSFDELYSGTNPEEAVISSVAFMEYLVKFNKVSCLLTTHFIKVCKKLKVNKSIHNYHMETKTNNDDFEYTYLLKKGISEVRGGIKVLTDMNYPQEIIDSTQKMKHK